MGREAGERGHRGGWGGDGVLCVTFRCRRRGEVVVVVVMLWSYGRVSCWCLVSPIAGDALPGGQHGRGRRRGERAHGVGPEEPCHPGQDPQQRLRFKMHCLAAAINQVASVAERLAPGALAASRGQSAFVVGGDFNLTAKETNEALQLLQLSVSQETNVGVVGDGSCHILANRGLEAGPRMELFGIDNVHRVVETLMHCDAVIVLPEEPPTIEQEARANLSDAQVEAVNQHAEAVASATLQDTALQQRALEASDRSDEDADAEAGVEPTVEEPTVEVEEPQEEQQAGPQALAATQGQGEASSSSAREGEAGSGPTEEETPAPAAAEEESREASEWRQPREAWGWGQQEPQEEQEAGPQARAATQGQGEARSSSAREGEAGPGPMEEETSASAAEEEPREARPGGQLRREGLPCSDLSLPCGDLLASFPGWRGRNSLASAAPCLSSTVSYRWGWAGFTCT